MESNIILALDIEDKEKALRLATEVEGLVKAYKVGYPLILSSGSSVVREISNIGEVIVDIKIADIPDVSRNIAKI